MTAEIPAHYPEWVRDHMQRYLSTDGADGHLWDAEPFGGKGMIPTLLLTTTDQKSGKSQQLPLIYIETPDGWAVIGSKGGAPKHPHWYINLSENPTVGVQILGNSYTAWARTATGAERETLWKELAELYPPFNEYVGKAAPREIPVVVLDRTR